MALPGSPLPTLSFPDTFEDVQVPAFPVLVSVSVITPDVATAFPPGVTVHVLAVTAKDEVIAGLITRSAVTAVSEAAAVRVRPWPGRPGILFITVGRGSSARGSSALLT